VTQRGRGFLMGATAGRTTLAGEGLQHDDGHTHILASTIPNVRAYDPAFAYELAAIVRDGIERMYVQGEDVFYYVTIYNENYAQPADARRGGRGILRGIYRFAEAPELGKGGHPPASSAPARSSAGARGARPARRAVRGRRRGLQRPVVPAPPPRRAAGGALEPPQPDEKAPASRT
jgi:hypothetical protein